jgi:dihydroflavonol-4-reductase
MIALVTGANGLLGNHIVQALLEDGHTVKAMVRPTSNLKALEGLDIEYAYGDVRDGAALRAAADGCDTIFHTAAVFSYWGFSQEEMDQTAREGAINVVDAARDAGVDRLVLTSSAGVLGRNTEQTPMTEASSPDLESMPAYFQSKALQEQVAFERAEEQSVDLVCVNPAVILGPNDQKPSASMGTITNYLFDPLKLTWPGGVNIVHAQDCARGHVLLAEKGESGERYLLGADNWRWKRVHETISRLCNVAKPTIRLNAKTALLGASLMEFGAKFTGKPPQATRDQAMQVGNYFWYNHTKAARLGYRSRSTRDAILETLAWLLDSPHLSESQRKSLNPSIELETMRRKLQPTDS